MRILQKFAGTISDKAFQSQKTEEIVEFCIDALRSFKINPEETVELKEAIFGQNRSMLPDCLKSIREEINALGIRKMSAISLGCGDESVFERSIDEDIAKNFPEIRLEWIGVDVSDYRSPSSFLRDKMFKIIDPHAKLSYRSLVETNNPVVLIGRWSYHHLGISFQEFLQRCRGISKIILVEEPTTAQLWKLSDYRVMRIAYDVLGNFIVSHSWAKEFMDDPEKFKVEYLFRENLALGVKIIDYRNMIPENSLVIIQDFDKKE